jgi:mono/diheme cytochrome c family protein
VLDRGRQRFNIYCAPCHSRLGDGQGMVVKRGYKQPPTYHQDRLRKAPLGYFFDVMTNGFGAMPDYSAQIPPRDRWCIVAYIRALQLSQNATAAEASGPIPSKVPEFEEPGSGATLPVMNPNSGKEEEQK